MLHQEPLAEAAWNQDSRFPECSAIQFWPLLPQPTGSLGRQTSLLALVWEAAVRQEVAAATQVENWMLTCQGE